MIKLLKLSKEILKPMISERHDEHWARVSLVFITSFCGHLT